MTRISLGVLILALSIPGVVFSQTAGTESLPRSAAYGAAIGAGAAAALLQTSASWCRLGCENDLDERGALLMAALGAGVGAAVGGIAHLDRHGARAGASMGIIVARTSYQSGAVSGRFSNPGASFTLQASPHVTFITEYQRANAELFPPRDALSAHVRDHVVADTSRVAGWSRGVERRRFGRSLSELIGVRVPLGRRLGVQVLGGVATYEREQRDYYDGGTRGTYKILAFQSPDVGFVYGSDVEIAVSRHCIVTTGVRAEARTESARTVAPRFGLQWRF